VGTKREKTGIEWKERKKGAECATRRERQSGTCAMNEREREEKERGEIRNEDGRGDRIDERDMEEEGKDREGEGWEIGINTFFLHFL
jgi:hypothetical protein